MIVLIIFLLSLAPTYVEQGIYGLPVTPTVTENATPKA
jgi:hypothetical protein